MLMLSAYFDETGVSEDSEVYAVGGYLATVESWEEFARLWGRMIYEARIPFYHASELEAFWKSKRYRQLIAKRDELVRLQKQALTLVHAFVPKGVFVSVIKKDFLDVFKSSDPNEYYSFCAQECLRGCYFWLTEECKINTSVGINYVFEEGAIGWGVFSDVIERLAKDFKQFIPGPVTKADKRAMHPLQAADMFVFEGFKEMVNGILVRERGEPRKYQVRELAKQLLRPTDTLTYFDRQRLIDAFVLRLKIPRRRKAK